MNTKQALFNYSCTYSAQMDVVRLQTDDSAYIDNKPFLELEEQKRNKFDSKSVNTLSNAHTVLFNNNRISPSPERFIFPDSGKTSSKSVTDLLNYAMKINEDG